MYRQTGGQTYDGPRRHARTAGPRRTCQTRWGPPHPARRTSPDTTTFFVKRAREAKQEILALLGWGSRLIPPAEEAFPTSQKTVAVLANRRSEGRKNADDLLRPPVGGLSGGPSKKFSPPPWWPGDSCEVAMMPVMPQLQ